MKLLNTREEDIMDSDEKIKAIKYICENVFNDNSVIYNKVTFTMILKSILEVCNG